MGNYSENINQVQDEKILKIIKGSDRGLLPRSLEFIIQKLQERKKDSYKLFISFFEVYNEKIYDLFSDKLQKDGLEIRE